MNARLSLASRIQVSQPPDAASEVFAGIDEIYVLLKDVRENHPLVALMESWSALDPDGSHALEVACGLTATPTRTLPTTQSTPQR